MTSAEHSPLTNLKSNTFKQLAEEASSLEREIKFDSKKADEIIAKYESLQERICCLKLPLEFTRILDDKLIRITELIIKKILLRQTQQYKFWLSSLKRFQKRLLHEQTEQILETLQIEEKTIELYRSLIANGAPLNMFFLCLEFLIQYHKTEARARGFKNIESSYLTLFGLNTKVLASYIKPFKKRSLEGLFPKHHNLHIPLNEAKDILLSSYGKISKEFVSFIKTLFEENCLMTTLRSGEHAHTFIKDSKSLPLIKMSYNNSFEDLLCLAHEVGHAIHQSITAKNGFLQMTPLPCFSETASLLSEYIVLDYLNNNSYFNNKVT
ncbi:MAG: M3 family oligoendopeptidase, partial [Caedimonadaceae bacterium]